MAVMTRKNQYRGVNAHLHSIWQNEGGWSNFHNRHIGDLAGLLIDALLPLGYLVTIEESIQIRRADSDDPPRRPKSDILIGDPNAARCPNRTGVQAAQPAYRLGTWIAPLETEKPYHALRIDARKGAGEPVAWIELLSQTNKRYSADRAEYLYKRNTLLTNGVIVIEIDYLHETPTTFDRQLMDYSRLKERDQAAPYRIMLLDPHPDMMDGFVYPYPFSVDQAIPTVTIPLRGEDRIAFDFGTAYHKTFIEMSYGLIHIDYAALPPAFETYSAADQTRIARRMLAVLTAHAAGVDLEGGADMLPVEDVSLDEASARVAALTSA
jgi:hypothetical protein